MTNDEATDAGTPVEGALIDALVRNLPSGASGWQSLTLILELDGDRLCGTYGYTYGEDGTAMAVSVRPRLVAPQVRAYLAARGQRLPQPPVKMLVQHDRRVDRGEVTFEVADRTRWQVTPANIDTIREELRPRIA